MATYSLVCVCVVYNHRAAGYLKPQMEKYIIRDWGLLLAHHSVLLCLKCCLCSTLFNQRSKPELVDKLSDLVREGLWRCSDRTEGGQKTLRNSKSLSWGDV